jgi:DNA-binding CsgD family transcriptional regulator
VVAAVHAAEAAGAADPAVGGYLQLARGQLRSRMPGQWERWRLVADVPSDVTAVPTSRSHELAWRGSVFALAGRFDDGIADLREFTGRVRDGAAEFGDGMFHAVLGYALWMRGDREQARIPICVAVESRLASAHPLVQAIAPLRRIGTGGLDQARRLLAEAFDGIRRAPFPPAIQVAGVVGTVIELVDGAPERRRALLPHLRRTLGDRAVDLSGAVSPLWRLHLGLAAAWAGETGLATTVAAQLDRAPSELAWRSAAVHWVRAQVHQANGDDNAARTELRRAVELGLTGLPLHADRLAADLARLDHTEPNGSSGGSPDGAADPLDLLSDRERDVVSLLTEGLSYAQIARELYVTRSTVAFHLSNAYAKTNTTSRHELVALVRARR